MKIANNYSKSAVIKKSKIMLAVCIVFQAILLAVMSILVVVMVANSLSKNISGQMDIISYAIKNGYMLDEEIANGLKESDNAFNNIAVYYYDSNRVLIGDAPEGVVNRYDDTKDNAWAYIDGVRYIARKGVMLTDGPEKYFIIYKDVTSEKEMLMISVWVSVGFYVVTFTIFVLMTEWIIRSQMKHYDQATSRNNQLISDISHEFNTPLAIIKVSLAKVMSNPEKKIEDVSDTLVTVTHEAGRLNRMVRDMLVLSRSDNSRLVLEKKNCNITDIVTDIVEPFQIMCELDDKKMDVKIAKNVKSRVDEDKLRQSIIILLDNAVKYTKPGDSISVTLKNSSNKYTITVADTGIGVPSDKLEKIFERFYRTDESRNLETGGAGLGLSIVKVISESLEGKVWASQNKPKGFRVDLEFPKEKFT